tara:strand:+ start:895 stop:1740 length:846 start_codon:yes stop_codon:yes gene_type:complete
MYKNHSHWFYNEYSETKGYFEKDVTYVMGSNIYLKKIKDLIGRTRHPRGWFTPRAAKKEIRNIPRSPIEHISNLVDRFNFDGRLLIYKNGIVTKYFDKSKFWMAMDSKKSRQYYWKPVGEEWNLSDQIKILKKIYPDFILNDGETNRYFYYSYKYILGEEFERWKHDKTEKDQNEMYKKIVTFLKKEYEKFLPYCKRVYQISDIIIDENRNLHLIDREEFVLVKNKNLLKFIYNNIENIIDFISMQIEFNQLGEQELSIDHKEEIYIKIHNNKNETKIYKF